MKKTKKSLLFSGLALMMSALLLAGTTFAWFTDSVTNKGNRIEAGTLQVDLLMDKSADGNYVSIANSTGDIFDEAQGGNGYNWEPGMTQVVYLAVKNNGSLAINYNFVLDVIDGNPGLVGSLKYAVLNGTKASDMDGVDTWEEVVAKANANVPTTGGTGDVVDGQTRFTPGRTLEAGEMATFAMAVHMDENADNQYQNGSIQIDVNVIAKQAASEADGFGNTDYDANAEWPTIPVGDTAEDLVNAVESAKPGDVLTLPVATYELTEPLTIPSGVTLLGAQAGKPASEWVNDETAEKTVIKAADGSDRVLKIEQNAGESVTDVVLDGILVDGEKENVKGIFVKKYDGSAMTGIVIRNCAVIDCANDGIDVSNTDGAVIENNYVGNVSDNGIRYGNYKNTGSNVGYVCNNVVENVSSTSNGAIAVTEGAGDVIVSGNIVRNVKSSHQAGSNVDMAESAIVVEKVNEGGVITIENNTLTNVEQGIAVYKFSAPTSDDQVVIQNNTVNTYSTFAIATSTLNYAKFTTEAVVAVTNNTFDGSASTKGAVYVEETNRYNETTTGWKVVASGNTAGDGTYSK